MARRGFPAPFALHQIVTPTLTLCGVVACIFGITLLCPLALGQRAADGRGTAPRPLITQPVDESQRTTLSGNTYPLARPEFDVGTAPASLPMERMLLVLKRSPEKESALRTLLDDQQDKGSPNYHRWLTPDQVGTQFGPTDADMQTITTWLQSHGFQVAGPSKGRTVIEFSGSAGQVQEAFHTTIREYIVKGEHRWANDRDPSIPTALTPAVAGIDSLHNFPRQAAQRFVGTYSEKTKSLTAPAPNYTISCSGGTCYAVAPYDFATIYDVLPLWNATPSINGTGETIAIVGRTNINPADPPTFWALFGLTVPADKLNIILNGPDPGINGDEAEADIDIQWSGAVAPQATIDFVTSESTETTDGIDLSAVYIVDNNLAPVMSESYGECELGLGTAGNQFYYTLWEQAAAQGISVFVSSGDNGSAACDNPATPAQYGLNVNGIASTPFNAAIGGTDFNQYNSQPTYWNPNNGANEESAKGYIPEVAWNNSCVNPWALTSGLGSTAEQVCNNADLNPFYLNSTGGSGGPSNCAVNTQGVVGSCTQKYPKPSWQKGAGVPNDSSRDLPDVSLFASNGVLTGSFYVICQSDQTGGVCNLNALAGYGGTSVASPAFAGIMSLVNQEMGVPQGVPGFALYQLASKQTNAFHDVPTGSTIAMPCVTASPNCTTNTPGDAYGVLSGYSTGTGYDLATGLGSVDTANLANNWSKATFSATNTELTLNNNNPINITHGTAVPVAIDVGPTAATGAASLVVSNSTGTTTGQGIDSFPLTNGVTGAGATTSKLPGGTDYYVMAHYSGDGTYGGSYSTPVEVTVTPENSQPDIFLVTFNSSGQVVNGNTTTAPYGSPYLLRVNVDNAAGKLCAPVATSGATACPTGTVTITDNGSPLDAGTYTLNSYGYFEDQTVQLPGGTNSITTAYGGDNSFNASTITTALSITPGPTTTQYTNAGTVFAGQPANLSTLVQTQSSGAAPTGTVTFSVNGTPLTGTPSQIGYPGSATTSAMLSATLSNVIFNTVGTVTIVASYSGDSNYEPSSSSTNVIVMGEATNTLAALPLNPQPGASVTLTALIDTSVKTPLPNGVVSFMNMTDLESVGQIQGNVTYTQTHDANGNAELQATLSFNPPTYTTSVQADYSGDFYFTAPQSNTVTVVVSGNDFGMYINEPSVSASAPGQDAWEGIRIYGQSNYNGTINFTPSSCSGLPPESSCSFSPASITGNGQTTIEIQTTAPQGQARRAMSKSSNWIAMGPLVVGALFLFIAPSRRRRASAVMGLIALGLLMMLPSCGGGNGGGGGGGGNSGTPVGTYSVSVTATSGSLSHSTSFTLVVQ